MEKLKYLFKVIYKDESQYFQNNYDKAVIKETGSSFSDVIIENVKQFILYGDNKIFLVDLTDGHFEINGQPFFMHNLNENLENFRLIFWRVVNRTINTSTNDETFNVISYQIGWQTTKNGKNFQEIMQIK
jgi:hypothetical protein